MNVPFVLPDWVPWWVPVVLLVPALLYALAFLFMPFSVLGVKTRLEVIEARLDDIQHDIRLMALRLPAGPQEVDFEEVYAPISQRQRREATISVRPPIPPAAQDMYAEGAARVDLPDQPQQARPARRQEPQVAWAQRAEPRLDRR